MTDRNPFEVLAESRRGLEAALLDVARGAAQARREEDARKADAKAAPAAAFAEVLSGLLARAEQPDDVEPPPGSES